MYQMEGWRTAGKATVLTKVMHLNFYQNGCLTIRCEQSETPLADTKITKNTPELPCSMEFLLLMIGLFGRGLFTYFGRTGLV